MKAKTRVSGAAALSDQGLIYPGHSRQDLRDIEKLYASAISANVQSAIQEPIETDPVARQYIPHKSELNITQAERADPIGDFEHSPVKSIVHRYPDRVLLKITPLCAVYCRFCFRREMVGPAHKDESLSAEELETALDYIRTHGDIREVILTGGDPFVLSARHLEPIFENINHIPHVKTVRIHTRTPIADPVRITGDLIACLPKKKATYIALHVNHAQELTDDTKRAISKLNSAGCTLLSQSVLLRGVNDAPDILEDLYRALISLNVKPYYLHHPDLAKGTSHFRLPLSEGRGIVRALQGRLSGIAQPHYMLDIPGGHGKVPINGDYIEKIDEGTYRITNYQGGTHIYKECV